MYLGFHQRKPNPNSMSLPICLATEVSLPILRPGFNSGEMMTPESSSTLKKACASMATECSVPSTSTAPYAPAPLVRAFVGRAFQSHSWLSHNLCIISARVGKVCYRPFSIGINENKEIRFFARTPVENGFALVGYPVFRIVYWLKSDF